MIEGQLEQSGACTVGIANSSWWHDRTLPIPNNKDNVLQDSFNGECIQKEGDI